MRLPQIQLRKLTMAGSSTATAAQEFRSDKPGIQRMDE
jgi:hypothetical protein